MKDRVSNDIGVKEPLEDWASINWKLVKKRVRNLRQRIYRATQNGQWNKVRSLMKLMLRSNSNRLLAIRRVTQENQGKKTAGIDGQTALTLAERVKLIDEMKGYNLWKVHPTKRVYIPKANGKQRPLGIPTIKDRIAQAIVKNAIEPSWEAVFEAQSYGFRPGRSCHDAIEQCHNRLRMGKNCPNDKWVLDADIKGAFDNISHEYILKTIGETPGRELIKQWLKAGYVEAEMFHKTESGTPQGGVISPLLANIALDGIETLLTQYQKVTEYEIQSKGRRWKSRVKSNKYGFIRYADDFIVTAQTKHAKHGKPYRFSGQRSNSQSSVTARKAEYLEGKGCWRKRKLLVMQEIEVQNLPHVERSQTSSGSSTINQSNGTEPKVKDRVRNDIGTKAPLEDWATINWKLVNKRVRNLRQRIYRATKNNQWNKVRSKSETDDTQLLQPATFCATSHPIKSGESHGWH